MSAYQFYEYDCSRAFMVFKIPPTSRVSSCTKLPHNENFSRYLVAASMASSIFPGLVPLPRLVAPFPPAFPPTMLDIVFVHSLAERPFLLASY